MAQPLVLDRQHLMAMLADPSFYDACPDLAHLKDVALASWQAYRDLDRSQHCCANDFKYMQGCVDAMFIKLRELKAKKPAGLADVKRYLSSKKGYGVTEAVIYYRRSKTQGKIAKFSF